MLIGLSKNILLAHFHGDYKLDSNFVSCILSKFSNFCAQINDAHWPKQEHLTCTLLWVISIESGALLIPQPEPRSPTRKTIKVKHHLLLIPYLHPMSPPLSTSTNQIHTLPSPPPYGFFRARPGSNTMFNPTLPCFTLSYISASLAPPRRFQAQ